LKMPSTPSGLASGDVGLEGKSGIRVAGGAG
jgi:hypothetical protein